MWVLGLVAVAVFVIVAFYSLTWTLVFFEFGRQSVDPGYSDEWMAWWHYVAWYVGALVYAGMCILVFMWMCEYWDVRMWSTMGQNWVMGIYGVGTFLVLPYMAGRVVGKVMKGRVSMRARVAELEREVKELRRRGE